MSAKQITGFILKTLAVAVAILIITVGASAVALPADMAAAPDEGGSVMVRLFIVCLVHALVLSLAITSSRWRGLPLILGLVFAFYGVQTLIGQVEAVVFLTPLGERWGAGSVPALTMPIEFITSQLYIGLAQAGLGIPLAVLLFGKAKRGEKSPALTLNPGIHGAQWVWKLGAIIVLYELLYFGFGYYVAWKDPAILNFYQGTDPGSFLAQMRNVATETPTLIPFQALRALLWTAFALPVVAMLRHKPRLGALITGLFLSLPMNIPHLVPNPYMPPDVRMVHFIETASSTFIFGVLIFWLLHRPHRTWADLLGRTNPAELEPQAEMQAAN